MAIFAFFERLMRITNFTFTRQKHQHIADALLALNVIAGRHNAVQQRAFPFRVALAVSLRVPFALPVRLAFPVRFALRVSVRIAQRIAVPLRVALAFAPAAVCGLCRYHCANRPAG